VARRVPAVALAAALLPAVPAGPPQYDLAPGDHLVFRTDIVREGEAPSGAWATRSEWESHVVVFARQGDLLSVGIQRNRRTARVLRPTDPEGQARLAARLKAAATVLTDATWVRLDGSTALAPVAVREEESELTPFVHELQPLPASALDIGARLEGPPPLGGQLRVTGKEVHGGEDCLRLDGKHADLDLRFDYCPASRLPARSEVRGRYPVGPSLDLRETITIERIGRRRGEGAEAWLRDEAVRLGALDAFLAAATLPVPVAALWALLEEADPEVQRRVLGVAYRHRLEPPRARVEALAAAQDPSVRRLAGRFLARAPEPAAVSEPLLALARAVRKDGPLPEWRCEATADRPAAMLAAQRSRGRLTGTRIESLQAAAFAGWPYVLHVPEDYRGDEPRPLLVVLGGGAGAAPRTAAITHRTTDPRGWLVAYPHAGMHWWEDRPTAMFGALLPELLRELNVDTNRVYLTGFSNGGAGTVLFAALWPDRFAAAAPLMGVGLGVLGARFPSVEGVTRLPWLFVHGARDTPAASEEIATGIRRADPSARVDLHVLPGRGHDVRLGSDEGLTLPFLERQVRDPFPREVRLRSREPGRAFWVDVIEKDGGLAEVDARIQGGTVAVKTRHVRRLRLRLRRELLGDAAAGSLRVSLNGRDVYDGPFVEDCRLMAESWRATGDPHLAHAWERTFEVPR
jgi:dienelactone hydrolase